MKQRISIALLSLLNVVAGIGVVYSQQTGQASSANEQKMTALKDALKNGVITQQEYDAKVAQLSGSGLDKIKWTTVSVMDPMFNMPAYLVTIPADWSFEGAVLHGSCGGGVGMLVYRVSSPDGLTGVQVMPRVDWDYAQDPRALKFAGVGACNLHAPVTAAKQAPDIATAARPRPEIGPVETLHSPGFAEGIEKFNQASANQARAFGRPNDGAHETGDEARVRIRYDFKGHPIEEWITVQTTIVDRGIPVPSTGANGILQSAMARMQHTQTFVTGMRAPQGTLDASRPLFMAMRINLVPEYDKAVMAFLNQQFAQVMAAGNAMFAATLKQGEQAHGALMNQNRQYQQNQAALKAQHDSYMAWQQQSRDANNRQFQADLNRKDAQNKNFVDYVSDQQYYLNPETGATVTVQNVPGANGVVAKSSWGNWVELVPISH